MKGLKGLELYISKAIGRVIMDYEMLKDNDKILVAVSGGKDSITLLHFLNLRRRFTPIKYQLLAVYVDLGYQNNIDKLIKYFESLGIDYHIEKVEFSDQNKSCFWCSWNRRKALFKLADRLGYNKIALGHHKDDIVETILLNLFFNGEISSMKPKQELFEGNLTIIRPLAYVEERLIIKFCKDKNLPYLENNCPNAKNSKRLLIKNIVKNLEKICPDVKTNIFRAIKRIRKDYIL